MTLVKSIPYGAPWKSKKAYIIRLKFDRKSTPLLHAVVATAMDLYHSAKGETDWHSKTSLKHLKNHLPFFNAERPACRQTAIYPLCRFLIVWGSNPPRKEDILYLNERVESL